MGKKRVLTFIVFVIVFNLCGFNGIAQAEDSGITFDFRTPAEGAAIQGENFSVEINNVRSDFGIEKIYAKFAGQTFDMVYQEGNFYFTNIPLTNIPLGNHLVEVVIEDSAGNTVSKQRNIYVTAPPIITVNSLTDGKFYNVDDVPVNIECKGAQGENCKISVSMKNNSYPYNEQLLLSGYNSINSILNFSNYPNGGRNLHIKLVSDLGGVLNQNILLYNDGSDRLTIVDSSEGNVLDFDGDRIIFEKDQSLFLKDLATNETSFVFKPEYPEPDLFSAKLYENGVIFSTANNIYQYTEGNVKKVGTTRGNYYLKQNFKLNGNYVIWLNESYNLVLLNVNTGVTTILDTYLYNIQNVDISPNGILFWSDRESNMFKYDNGTITPLAMEPGYGRIGQKTDGNIIVYVIQDAESGLAYYDGNNEIILIATGYIDTGLIYDVDAGRIAYVNRVNGIMQVFLRENNVEKQITRFGTNITIEDVDINAKGQVICQTNKGYYLIPYGSSDVIKLSSSVGEYKWIDDNFYVIYGENVVKVNIGMLEAPTVDVIGDKDEYVTGKGTGNKSIMIFEGTNKIGSGTADKDGNFQVKIPLQQPGKQLSIYTQDNLGNRSKATNMTVIDNSAPKVDGVINNGLYNQDVTITFNEGSGTLNGNPFQSGTVVIEDGSYDLTVTDEARNQTQLTFTIDKTAPKVDGVKNDGLYNKSVEISFEEGTATLNGYPYKSGTEISAEGNYVLVVADEAGNQTQLAFTIDKTAPNVDGVENDRLYNRSVEITFEEGIATLNEDPYQSGTPVIEDGNYTLVVTDEAGNQTQLTFTIDKTAPNVDGVENDGMYNKSVEITFEEGTATLNGDPYQSGTPVIEDGNYTLVVTDEAGNKTQLTFTIDKTAPNLVGVADGGFYNESVEITFEEGTATLNGDPILSGLIVSEEGTYTLELADKAGNQKKLILTIDKTNPRVYGIANSGVYNKSVTITFNEGTATLNGSLINSGTVVTLEGSYSFEVKDEAGNQTKLGFIIDKTSPSVPTILTVSDQSTIVSGKTEAYAEVKLNIAGKYLKTVTADRFGVYKFTITKQRAMTEIKVTASDKAKNVSSRIVKVIDKTAPVIPTIGEVSDKSIGVSGKTEANALVMLYINGKYLKSVAADKYGSYKLTIAKQKAGTEIKVLAKDKAGNQSSVRTVKVVDKTPPSTPSANPVKSKSTSVTGKAEKAATVYVYKGKTYLGKAIVDTKGKFKVKIKAAKKGTILTVFARDKAKNQSGKRSVKVY